MSDTEKIHRWLSQAELDQMLEQAYQRGAEAMRRAAIDAVLARALYWNETSISEGGITTMEDRAEEASNAAAEIIDLTIPEVTSDVR